MGNTKILKHREIEKSWHVGEGKIRKERNIGKGFKGNKTWMKIIAFFHFSRGTFSAWFLVRRVTQSLLKLSRKTIGQVSEDSYHTELVSWRRSFYCSFLPTNAWGKDRAPRGCPKISTIPSRSCGARVRGWSC